MPNFAEQRDMLRQEKISLVRAELACQSSGRAGLAALQAQPAISPLQCAAYAQAITEWLEREMSAYQPHLQAHDNRFTIKFAQGPQVQLRFVPRYCRWALFVKRSNYWWPQVPARGKRCLALSDWLGQIRQIVTQRAPLTSPGPRDIVS